LTGTRTDTLWGKWNPEYVNARPKWLATAKSIHQLHRDVADSLSFYRKRKILKSGLRLMDTHGYLENLMRPMSEIGPAPIHPMME
jgi:hypothetical protein